jgi:hypothetical protein
MMADEANRWQQAAEQRREQRCADGEEDDLRVHAQRVKQRQSGGERVREKGKSDGCESEAEQAAGSGEQERFCNRAAH